MKKLLFAPLLFVIVFVSCKKEQVDTPIVDFNLYQLDSAQVYTFSQAKLDSISSNFVSQYLISLPEGVSTRVYKGRVVLKYTGSPATYKVVYTGDPSHIYIQDPNNPPAGVTVAQAGVSLTSDIYSYTYPAGTYSISLISSNVGDKGNVVNRSIATKSIIVR